MKKAVILVLTVFLSFCCAPKEHGVEKIMEDGVEVIVNHLEPYKIKGQLSSFTLQKEFTIDFERDDLAELGIGTVRGFDIDSKGNIYCLSELQIFKFDSKGDFEKKFGKKGQGPGEFTYPGNGRITDSDEIVLYDGGNNKFLFFNGEGEFLKEIRNSSKISLFGGTGAVYLDSGGYLFEEMIMDLSLDKLEYHLTVLNSDLEKIKELEEKVYKENPFKSNRYNLFDPYIKYQIFGNHIYVTSQSNEDYEINIYDFQGNKEKKIKKEYYKVRITEEFKRKVLDSFKDTQITNMLKTKGYFQEYYPPIKNLYVDNKGRIYVETYEEGETLGEEMMDIFNVDGIFISRKSLKKTLSRKFKNDCLYAVYEKESGFQELVVHQMTWK